MDSVAALSTEAEHDEVRRRFRKHQLSMLATLILFYAFSYTCRLGLSVVKKPLLDGGVYTATELGTIGASFLYAYGVGKFFNGFLSDYVNIRYFMPLGLLVSALANGLMGATTFVLVASLAWALNGMFQGVAAPASVVLITRWFSDKARGRVYGLWSSAHALGEGLTYVGSAALVGLWGWRGAFWGPGLVCVVVALLSVFFLRNHPQDVGLPPLVSSPPKTATEKKDESVVLAQWQAVKMPALWVLGLASAAMYVTRYAVNNWGILFLQEHHGYSLEKAGAIVGLSTVAGMFGSAAFGVLSDMLFDARRPPLTLLFGLVELAGLGLFYWAPQGATWMLAVGLVVYGFTLSGLLAVLGGLFAVDLAPKKAAGAVMGFIGIFSYLGAGLQEMVSGLLIDAHTTWVNGQRVYDFSWPIYFWVGSAVLSIVLAASLWNKQSAS